MSRWHKYSFRAVLIATILVLIFLNHAKARELDVEEPTNIVYDNDTNTIKLDSLTLRQKIAQMTITYGVRENSETYRKMFIGGVHLGTKESKEEFISIIDQYQNNTIVPFFMTIDLEGCLNPFENFQTFPTFKEIETKEEAYSVAKEQGILLREIGFNVNFAPVVDLEDNIWHCRTFPGKPEEISEKARYFITGLSESDIIATAKHFPGKTLMKNDPHVMMAYATIEDKDLLTFEETMNETPAIMISHVIVEGAISSNNKPSAASEELVAKLRSNYSGLIITDEIGMLGMKTYYHSFEQMFIDVFTADNDIILYFKDDPKKIDRMITTIEKAVKRGDIKEERIDRSVRRILEAKGINVE